MTHRFFMVGTRIINPNMITYADFNSSEGEGKIEVNLLDGTTLYFEGEEASVVKQWFLHGDRTFDLNNLYAVN